MGIFDVPVVVLPHIRAGKLKALAITSFKRSAESARSADHSGEPAIAKVLSDNWYGLVGPVGMPPAILQAHPCGGDHGAQFARARSISTPR